MTMRLAHVARPALEPAVLDLARRIVDNAPLTVRAAKFAIRQCVRDPAAWNHDAGDATAPR